MYFFCSFHHCTQHLMIMETKLNSFISLKSVVYQNRYQFMIKLIFSLNEMRAVHITKFNRNIAHYIPADKGMNTHTSKWYSFHNGNDDALRARAQIVFVLDSNAFLGSIDLAWSIWSLHGGTDGRGLHFWHRLFHLFQYTRQALSNPEKYLNPKEILFEPRSDALPMQYVVVYHRRLYADIRHFNYYSWPITTVLTTRGKTH